MSSSHPTPTLSVWEALEDELRAQGATLPPAYLERRRETLSAAEAASAALAGQETPAAQEGRAAARRERDDEMLSALIPLLHERARSALCLSGGGIRSATYALGLVQQLARRGVLGTFDYVSTVSGGGYLGSWLSAWVHRDGLPAVVADLARPAPSPTEPEPPQVAHLRAHSNYLSPRVGLMSADTWTVAATYVRNLLLNWSVLLPVLAAVLLVPRVAIGVVQIVPTEPTGLLASFLFAHAFVLLGWALVFIGLQRPTFARQGSVPPWALALAGQEALLLLALLPIVLAAILLSTYFAWLRNAGGQIAETLPYLLGWGAATNTAATAVYLWLGGWDRRAGRLTRILRGIELILAPVVGMVAGGLLVLVASLLLGDGSEGPRSAPAAALYVTLSGPAFLGAFLVAGTVFLGLSSRLTDDQDLEWWARFGAWVLIGIVAWAFIHAVVLLGPAGLLALWDWSPSLMTSLGGASGLITFLLGRAGRKPNQEERRSPTWQTWLSGMALELAAPVFAVLVIIGIALGTTMVLDALMHQSWFSRLVTWVEIEAPRLGPLGGLLPRHVSGGHAWSSHWSSPGEYLRVISEVPWWIAAGLATASGALAVALSACIRLNKFSLHGMYRNRLMRAYLGASHRPRRPNAFTGFDLEDNVQMFEMVPGARVHVSDAAALAEKLQAATDPLLARIWQRAARTRALLSDRRPVDEAVLRGALNDDLTALVRDPALAALLTSADAPATADPPPHGARHWELWLENRALLGQVLPELAAPRRKLLHVVNVALNLVQGAELAWQRRKAASFTLSPLHAGSGIPGVGFRRAAYLDADPRRYYGGERSGVSLATAMTISGAAANPNMGYHSTSVVAFLLTLFNLRLGWWLGNPGPPGDDTFYRGSPRLLLRPLVDEMLGMTSAGRPYVHLSDGGHFENLALYEMVRRRCRTIIVSDAGCDADYTFEDLGNAVGKIRVDLGIPIEFLDVPIRRWTDPAPGPRSHGAVGLIRYDVQDGREAPIGLLIYLKPTLCGSPPQDVLHYARAHTDFPHESTNDQWFDEAQFESYRALGAHTIAAIVGDDFVRRAPGAFSMRVYEYLANLDPLPRVPPTPLWLNPRTCPDSTP
jgi:hypothetical protein